MVDGKIAQLEARKRLAVAKVSSALDLLFVSLRPRRCADGWRQDRAAAGAQAASSGQSIVCT
jgi:hypothetical protein